MFLKKGYDYYGTSLKVVFPDPLFSLKGQGNHFVIGNLENLCIFPLLRKNENRIERKIIFFFF